MPRYLDRSWLVFESIENVEHDRCVDLFQRPDGTFGFNEFRRDPEDGGGWTPTGNYSALSYPSRETTLSAAKAAVGWLATNV